MPFFSNNKQTFLPFGYFGFLLYYHFGNLSFGSLEGVETCVKFADATSVVNISSLIIFAFMVFSNLKVVEVILSNVKKSECGRWELKNNRLCVFDLCLCFFTNYYNSNKYNYYFNDCNCKNCNHCNNYYNLNKKIYIKQKFKSIDYK